MTPPEELSARERQWLTPPAVPHVDLDEAGRRRLGLPGTLLPAPEGLRQPLVFDPALKQFGRAYRAGEPVIEDAAARRAWHRARRTALDLVLAGLAGGRWAEHLVLRGSVLLATWFGDRARDPGDLDFVVTPAGWAMDGPETAGLLDDLAEAAEAAARAHGGVAIDAAGRVTEDIWTYERVPGRRMVLPWTAPGTPGGTVQLDLVFNEPLPAPAERFALRPLGDGPGAELLGASPGLSLAWKLLWLVSDAYPQGKDLYDAVLLTELAPPSYALLQDAFLGSGQLDGEQLRPPGAWWCDWFGEGDGWQHFVTDYPEVAARAADFPARLTRALEPALAEAEQPGDTTQTRWARWLAPLVEVARAEAEPAVALGRLAESGRDGLIAAIVVLRELRGPAAVSPEEALHALLAADDRWRVWREHPRWWPELLARFP